MPRRELIVRNFSIDTCLDVLFFSAPLNAQATPVLASPENSIIPGHQLSLTGFKNPVGQDIPVVRIRGSSIR